MRVDARLLKKDCDELARRIEAHEREAAGSRQSAKGALETIEQIILVVTAVDYAYRVTFKMAPSTWKKLRRWLEKRRKLAEAPEPPGEATPPGGRGRDRD